MSRIDGATEGQDGLGKDHILEEFWQQAAARTPLIEYESGGAAEVVVTFVRRDAEAQDVLLFVNRLTDERNLAASLMNRVPGTDIWHLSYRMSADWRASYAFLPHYPGQRRPWTDDHDQIAIRHALDLGRADPRNPDRNRNRSGIEQSVVALPAAPPQTWLQPRGSSLPAGKVSSETTPSGRRVWVYRPGVEVAGPFPVLVMFDGDVWTSSQSLATTLDNLVHDGEIPPMYALLLDSVNRETRWTDLDEQGGGAGYVVEELLPWARAHHPITDDSRRVITAGQSLGGLAALWTAVRHPAEIGAVLSQSASLWQEDLLTAASGAPPIDSRIYLEVGRQEWVLLPPNRTLAAQLADAGVEVELVEYNGGHDYACWRGGVADGLRWITRDWPR